MTTPEKMKALYDTASKIEAVVPFGNQHERLNENVLALGKALNAIDGGGYNPNLSFEPQWLPIADAPKDSVLVWAKGFNWGDESKGVHVQRACFIDGEWHGENELLKYLTHYQPIQGKPEP